MSDMKRLIEKMDQFAGQAVGQKPGDQVRGTEKATPKKSGKHPFAGRLVGASESKSILADLEKELVEGAVKRGLKEEFEAFKAEGAPELLKAEIPLVRQIEQELEQHGYEKGTEEYRKVFNHMLSFHRKFGNAYRPNWKDIEEGMTPDNMFLDKASRVKQGDKVVYKGKVVGIATGEVKNGQILFKPVEGEYARNLDGIATLPIDDVYLKEDGLSEHIVKHGSGYRLLSHKGKNLGDFASREAAEKHEREVVAFKHMKESKDMCNVCGQTPCNCTSLNETRLMHSDQKVNLFYKPDERMSKAQIVAKLIPNSKVNKYIQHFVEKFGVNPRDFEASPAGRDEYEVTEQGVYIPPPGEASAGDSHSPSPIGSIEIDEDNQMDTVTMDIPFLIRVMEFSREDAKDDMILHSAVEKMLAAQESSETGVLTMDQYESIFGAEQPEEAPQEEVTEQEEFGYKKLHPEIFKARQKYPAAKSDMEALIMAVRDEEHNDVNRLDTVNDREDAEIDALDHEEDHLQAQIKSLKAQLGKLEAMASARAPMEEDVPPPVATAGGPAGANQPKQQPAGVQPTADPAQQALLKQNQAKLQQNLAGLKTAGVQIDPAKAAQSLQKTDTGAPLNAMDKDTISAMAPAIGNVMSNPSTATQLNTLIKKAGGGA
jgi:hypothetical protein